MSYPAASSAPAVTVLMAVFNGMPYLRAAVDSVLAQTFRDFEFLIVNDGSADGSAALLHEAAQRDPRVRVIDRENRGFVASLNEGLAAARGTYIARFDADDVCLPHRLQAQVAYLQGHPSCVLVGGYVNLIDGAGRPLWTLRPPVTHAEIDSQHLMGHTSIPHPVATFRREVALRVGGYNPAFPAGQDLDLWLRLAEVGELHNLPEPLIQYRQHHRSISSTRADVQMEAMREGCRQAWTRRKIQGNFEMETHWRPSRDRQSRLDYTLSTGWCAFMVGHRRTAVVYGAKAVRLRPTSLHAWKLFACALGKRRRGSDPTD